MRIYNAALDMILWSNVSIHDLATQDFYSYPSILLQDLYSYRIEYAKDGEKCSNVIIALIYEKGFDLQETADYIGVEFKSLLNQFLSDKAALPSFGPETDTELRAYIFGLETWIIGNLRFSLETPRYLGEDRVEIRNTFIVKLFPSCDTEDNSD